MRKLWVFSLKEVLLVARDTGALISMLVTPLVLTLAIGAAFGRGGASPISDIPVLIVDQDHTVFSSALIEIFESAAQSGLVRREVIEDSEAARGRVERDEVAALVIIPQGFGERMAPLGAVLADVLDADSLDAGTSLDLSPEQLATLSSALQQMLSAPPDPTTVEIYASPNRTISTAVIRSITTQGIEALNSQVQGRLVTMARLMADIPFSESHQALAVVASVAPVMGADEALSLTLPIELEVEAPGGRALNWLDYSATSIAVLFLMFSMTSGGRSLLAEREAGTLQRLLVSPTGPVTVLLGKMSGIITVGVLQMLILWRATELIGAHWGPPIPVIAAILVLVLCASSVGALISAWAKQAWHVSALGSTITLVGSALAGTFFERWKLPTWVQHVSYITPNAWGIEIFARLHSSRSFGEIVPWLGGVLLVTALYYGAAFLGFRRQID